jgi:hypothetical protein
LELSTDGKRSKTLIPGSRPNRSDPARELVDFDDLDVKEAVEDSSGCIFQVEGSCDGEGGGRGWS